MVLWLICMYLLTVATARRVPEELEAKLSPVLEYSDYLMNYNEGPPQNRIILFDEYIETFRSDDVELAMMLYKDHEPYMTSESLGRLEYYSSDHWFYGAAYETGTDTDGSIYVDLETFLGDDSPLMQQIREDGGLKADVIRLTGVFYGKEFYPYELATFDKGLRYFARTMATLGPDDSGGELDWQILHSVEDSFVIQQLEDKEDLPMMNGLPLFEFVSIYTTNDITYGRAIQESPNTLPVFDRQLQEDLESHWINESETYDLSEAIVFRRFERNVDGYCLEAEAAIRCYPLKDAMKQLWFAYLSTLAGAVGLVLLCRKWLKQRLEAPMEQILHCADRNMSTLHKPVNTPWKELHQLQQSYITAQTELQKLRQDNTRLQTALSYAKNAETNRRQLVSNITHELKTPLAVVHSYCEGLQAGIAPEKQQKYLDVITGEADRMDAMVLEMLDLSRLESGKVRLAMDPVELLTMTRSTLARLEPLLDEKELTVEFGITSDCPLTADESRLNQVITNLIINAIKYSPTGGKITVNVFQKDSHSHFSIENESQPLSREALEKIWESFYRTEQSRTTKGTGLGLPICKAIIELHGGSCHVHNTSTGVEFSFTIP